MPSSFVGDFYKIGEHEGQLFITMACYDGQTLKNHVERGPLTVNEAAAAHKAYLIGNRDEGGAAVRGMERPHLVDGDQWYHTANVYGLLGETGDRARLLNKAIQGGFLNFPFMQRDFFLDPVRDDPGIQRVLEPARAQHEAIAATFCSECWPMRLTRDEAWKKAHCADLEEGIGSCSGCPLANTSVALADTAARILQA